MRVYRYLAASTLIDVIVTAAPGDGHTATAYVVSQSSLTRRPVMCGSDVVSAHALHELRARDDVVSQLRDRFGPLRPTSWAGERIDEPDFLRIVT